MAEVGHGALGKLAERQFKRELEARALSADFASWRFPDARAGSFQPALSDFLVVRKGQMFLIEVKSVGHAYRLPHRNFDDTQINRMRRFQLAGAVPLVFVHSTVTNQWRLPDFALFSTKTGGSWDLTPIEAKPLEVLLNELWKT